MILMPLQRGWNGEILNHTVIVIFFFKIRCSDITVLNLPMHSYFQNCWKNSYKLMQFFFSIILNISVSFWPIYILTAELSAACSVALKVSFWCCWRHVLVIICWFCRFLEVEEDWSACYTDVFNWSAVCTAGKIYRVVSAFMSFRCL